MFDDKPFRLEKQTNHNNIPNKKPPNKKSKICDKYSDLENNELSSFIKQMITSESDILLEKISNSNLDNFPIEIYKHYSSKLTKCEKK